MPLLIDFEMLRLLVHHFTSPQFALSVCVCILQIYAVSITIRIVFGFMLIALIWKFDFAPFMVLIIAILNDGTNMTISKDRVKPSSTGIRAAR